GLFATAPDADTPEGSEDAPSESPPKDVLVADTGGQDARKGDASVPLPPGKCLSAADCDDKVSCTTDTCVSGACVHGADSSLCGAGMFCEVLTGCVQGVACADNAQCTQKFGDDACKTQIACNPSLAICTYKVLDKDGDGQAPAICGGKDCDDAD